jgi:hypothetical protein
MTLQEPKISQAPFISTYHRAEVAELLDISQFLVERLIALRVIRAGGHEGSTGT